MTPPSAAALSVETKNLLPCPAARGRARRTFGSGTVVDNMPNLNEMQCLSYAKFLQSGVPASKREMTGLQEVLSSIFPIKDFGDKAEIDFVRYEMETPKYDTEECMRKSVTYAAPLRVTLRLSVFDVDEDTGLRSIRDIKEQDVYLVDMPLMTDNGTFIVNGTERVVVSQMHRSPGVFFDHDSGKTHVSGKYLFSARVIPYRGSWLDFEFDAKDLLYVRIDRRRKLPATTLLRALDSEATEKYRKECEEQDIVPDPLLVQGMSNEEILATFYQKSAYSKVKNGWSAAFSAEAFKGVKLLHDLVNAKTGDVVAEAGEKITPRKAKKLAEDGLKNILISSEELIGKYLAEDIICKEKGEVLFEAGAEITEEDFLVFDANGIKELSILEIDGSNVGPYIRNTLVADKSFTREEALIDIYRIMRPGEPPTVESAQNLFGSLFFDPERYDLSAVGRVKLNARLDLHSPDDFKTLCKEDILSILKYLHGLKDGKGDVDDIDNLGNRRVRSVGELMENQVRLGLLRMERAIKERMSAVEIDTYMPHDLINSKPAQAAVREFFGSSQLSQFMDQTNPLSEITHKRRLSALGPGGLTRERAGFEVRDVHPTHYGRICPIETPEGPNIGLINSLATFARVNPYGFIESPYRKVENGKVTDEVQYMSAMVEAKYTVAQTNSDLDKNGKFTNDLVSCRKDGENLMATPEQIEYIDVSPKQIVSVAAALIPFLENDDANRALMGSNMQRQAVPLLRSDAPLVGTGMEAVVAKDSGAAVSAKRAGVVTQVDATRIVIQTTQRESMDEPVVDIYKMSKFQRSNQNTCINQKPIVKVGDKIAKGDIIADGPSTQYGELALGRNILVAFMPWHGYNFEDSILISERLVKDDVFTSIHIESFEVMARDTKLGTEEITRDIPNIGEEALRQLDEAGIVHVGAEVKPGDILVGKVTPKGETPMTPEEKLLRAIFGEKASDVRDSSLRLPSGASGTIIDVSVFTRSGVDMDARALSNLQAEIARLQKDQALERRTLEDGFYTHLENALSGQKVTSAPKEAKIKKGTELNADILADVKRNLWRKIAIDNEEIMSEIEALSSSFDKAIDTLKERFDNRVEKLQRGDDLLPGVMKVVKVFVAIKRKTQPGDKMAGRHGNKGIVSNIVPEIDMPYTKEGKTVDIILNPLGVPSRMNIGQILEVHLGMIAKELGEQIQDMFDAHQETMITDLRAKMAEIADVAKLMNAKETLGKLSDDELLKYARDWAKGVKFAATVFEGANIEEFNKLFELAKMDADGKTELYDGKTGEKMIERVNVGYMYMLKLHHLVDEKVHARSTGPYSLVTQQPVGGKALFGGQRFGEMEVWALEAYGASHILKEMLTIKSDDVDGRTRAYRAITKGESVPESGVPETMFVLTKELQALGLDVDLYEKKKEGDA